MENETNQEWFESIDPEIDLNEMNKIHIRSTPVHLT
jgi:hypothetical protein